MKPLVRPSTCSFTLIPRTNHTFPRSLEFRMKRYSLLALSLAGLVVVPVVCTAQSADQRLEIDRKGQTIILEPYAPNILRVTLSLQRDNALAKPGYGFVGVPTADGWSKNQTDINDVYQSSRIIATVERDHPPAHPKLSTELDIA